MANFNLNKIVLGGRLTARPELKQSQTGISVAQFNVAVARRQAKDKQRETDYIPCVAWRERAEFLCRYFDKGSSICVIGTLQIRQWTDASGQKRSTAEVVADEITFVDSKSETQAAIVADPLPAPSFEDLEDPVDLPF